MGCCEPLEKPPLHHRERRGKRVHTSHITTPKHHVSDLGENLSAVMASGLHSKKETRNGNRQQNEVVVVAVCAATRLVETRHLEW